MTTYARMADAAFPQNIPPGFPIAAGYYPGLDDFHAWTPADWGRFPGYRLPVTVPADPGSGPLDGGSAVAYLRNVLHVPEGCITGLDLETRVDVRYVLNFGQVMQDAGYKVWVYGSQSTVFQNPPLNGYWPAVRNWTAAAVERLLQQPHVRAAQIADLGGYDVSYVKPWTEGEMWHG